MSERKPLFEAIKHNDIYKLQNLIRSGVDVDDVDSYGYSALHVASAEQFIDMLNILLNADIDPNIKDSKGQTFLHYAAVYGQMEGAELALSKGADLTIADNYGNQPLWTAVFNDKGRNDRVGMIKLFLKYGADAHHKNNAGKSPKDIVAIAGYDNLVDIVK